jgi:hypothetical protein
MEMLFMEAEVREGMALLDKKNPDWRLLVDPDNISMRSNRACILAQIFGSYIKGCGELDLHYEDESYGFFLKTGRYSDYEPLGETWATLLRMGE